MLNKAFGAIVAELPLGTMRRVTRGDLDVLLVHTPMGIAAVDDRCPHMAAPLSLGELDGFVITCPLHSGPGHFARHPQLKDAPTVLRCGSGY